VSAENTEALSDQVDSKYQLYLQRVRAEFARVLSHEGIPEEVKQSLLESPEFQALSAREGGSHDARS
jgi:hypothetical protein